VDRVENRRESTPSGLLYSIISINPAGVPYLTPLNHSGDAFQSKAGNAGRGYRIHTRWSGGSFESPLHLRPHFSMCSRAWAPNQRRYSTKSISTAFGSNRTSRPSLRSTVPSRHIVLGDCKNNLLLRLQYDERLRPPSGALLQHAIKRATIYSRAS